MKLHLPVRLFKSVLACLAAVASFSLGSGVAWAEVQNLTFSGSSLIWDTSAENKPFVDEEDAAASFAAGDNVSFSGESTVTLGEDISAGTVAIEKGADITIDLDVYELNVDRIELSGSLDVGDSLSIGKGASLAMTDAGAVLDSNLVLGEEGVLSVTGAGGSLGGHSLTLQEGASLILTGAVISRETTDVNHDGELSLIVTPTGDGKTYALLTGVSELVDKYGNSLAVGSYSTDELFDSSLPGSGFWTGGTLVYASDGTLTLVLHNETVKDALDVTTRQTGSVDYSYYAGVSFKNLTTNGSYGGAIYGDGDSTITLSNNGSVVFEGNTSESASSNARGGAIFEISSGTITLSNNGSVTFSGNTVSGRYSYGGAIEGFVMMTGNGDVSFSGNTASGSYYAYGGAIYGYGDITLSDNGSVVFEGNTASSTGYDAYGGAIYGGSNSSIMLNNNGSVTFSGNTASSSSSYARGGAIYGDSSSDITLSNNGSVTFSGNTASSTGYDAYGGAIDGSVTMTGNGDVSFSGNTASGRYAYGGAIDGGSSSTITLSNNGSVSFSGNTASGRYAYGGAIYGGDSSTITLSNNVSMEFTGNTASSSGGAIYGYGSITIDNNGSVSFIGNTASSSDSSAYGGAIDGSPGSNISLNNNGSVTFSGNKASGRYAYCGAIYTSGDLSIRNNDSVLFEKNVEKSGSTYRLSSIYAVGGDVISLSAAAGKSIEFRDSVYIASGSTVNLNADYTYLDEAGESVTIRQTGDIIFTGADTEQHLNDLLEAAGAGRTATAQEILNSRTTAIYTMPNLFGGRLRVEEGAIYQGQGITAMEGSAATVRVQNATLKHSGYDLTFNAGTTLELAGNNTITGNVRMLEGSSLLFDLSQYQGVTIHSGSWNVADETLVCVELDSSGWTGEWGEIKTIALLNTNADLSASRFDLSISPLTGNWEHSGLQWVDGTLSIAFKNGATNAEWTNAAGDFRWNNESYNWTDSGCSFARVNGADVTFGKSAEGSILLDGQMEVGKMTVSAESAYTLDFEAGASLVVQKELVLEHGATLTFHGNLDAAAVKAQGALVVDGNVDMNGALNLCSGSAITGHVSGATGATLTNASITGELAMTGMDADVIADGGSIGSITGANDVTLENQAEVKGSITMSGALEMTNASAASVSGATSAELSNATIAGKLEAVDTEVLKDSAVGSATVGALKVATGASLTADGAVAVTGAVDAAGSLTVEGSLTAASLQAFSLEAAGLILTDSSAASQVTGSVQVSGQVQTSADLTVGGAMSALQVSVAGALTAASLQTEALEAASLTLTDGAASNRIGSSVAMTGAVDAAGSLTVEGSLTAASLQAFSLVAAGLILTDSSTASQVTGAVQVSGQVQTAADLTVGGAMSAQQVRVDGALTAASLQTEALEAASLTLTDAAASNRIGSSVAMTGAVESAGSLTVEGTLTAAELTAGGALSAQQVSVAGALTAASLQTEALEAASLTLTDGAACNRIGSSVAMTGAVESAGSLTVEGTLTAAELTAGGALSAQQVSVAGALTAASLQTEALETSSLNLTDAAASNRIGSSVAMTGAVESAGSLTVEGALTAASVQTGALEVGSLVLTAGNTVNTVTGNLTADSVSLVAGSSLTVDGVLTTDEVQMSGTALTLTAGSFGASTMNFELDRAALESLGLGYKQTGTIAQVSSALASGFVATLNGGADEVLAGAYKYTLSASGSSVQVTADYAFDGMQVWYRGAWVGKTDWSDFYVGGYDAVDGVESIDLSGETVEGANLFVAYEEGVTSAVVTNGSLLFDYVDLGGGQFEIGTDASVITSELYGKGETLVLHDGAELNATELTLGTLVLNDSDVTVKKAAINAITGTEGTLAIETGGSVTVKSDVILTGLTNEGSLNLGKKTLTVNALVDVGGNVTAGEVSVQSRGSRMAEFNKLVADKVTVSNSVTAGRYTDDLSVGDGSAIGELEAETLEVRGGTVTLGRSSGGTEMSLLNLDLQEDATLVLNQKTALAVTDTLTATENATVQLKQDASLSYGEVYLTNKKSDSVASVNASGLSGEADLQVQNAHVVTQTADATIDYQLVNSTVENAAGGTLKVTHENNTLNGVYATGGNVEVYNVSAPMSLEELRIATGLSVSLMTCAPETTFTPENEAAVTVVGLAVFEKGATLNANLTLAAGSELRMEGPLHMGSTLELVSGADSITLSGSMLDAVMHLGECESYTLFTGVDALTLTFDGNSVTYQPGTLNEGHKVLASTYFSNFVGTAQEDSLYITFNIGEVGGGELAFYQAPEPTTATLSLLALAALAARRRRK